MMGLMLCVQPSVAQTKQPKDSTELVMNDTVAADSAMALIDADLEGEDTAEGGGLSRVRQALCRWWHWHWSSACHSVLNA